MRSAIPRLFLRAPDCYGAQMSRRRTSSDNNGNRDRWRYFCPSCNSMVFDDWEGIREGNPLCDCQEFSRRQIEGGRVFVFRCARNGYTDTHLFTDEEDIYSFEKYRESREVYHQRTTDIAVIDTGEAVGVTTYVVMAPTIFGQGTGPFNLYSIQLPSMIADALSSGAVGVVGQGNTVWSHVLIRDLASVIVVMLHRICEGVAIPSRKKGIYFCETGEHSHREFSEHLATAAFELGVLPSSKVKKITLEEAGEKLALGRVSRAELAFAANAQTKAILGYKLGWVPSHGGEWETTLHDEVNAFIKSPRGERDIPEFLRKN